jgi:hypothetical protein
VSTAIAKNFQVGSDGTATNNFTIRQPATPDGTVRIANGNSGTTTDLVTVTSAGDVGVGVTAPTAKLDVSGTAAVSGAFSVAGNNISAVNSMGFRNRIINGDMRIDQRNAGAAISYTAATQTYLVDRWLAYLQLSSKFTIQQNQGSVTPPAGFSNYLGFTSSAATTPGSTDLYVFAQKLEGFNIADFGWGAAGAQAVTLSFWVRSSLTGTFGGSLFNSAANRNYVFSYTINAANTWEQKTITITGDTSGTWLTNNGAGIQIWWNLGSGSSNLGTAGSWGATGFYGPTGSTSVVGTNGATFYITGVQLEAGSVATPFERRDYGRELMLCQRYLPAWSGTSGNQDFCSAFNQTTTTSNFVLTHPVTTRVPTTGATVSGSIFFTGSNNAYAASSVAFVGSSTGATRLSGTISGGTAGAGGAGFGQGTWSIYLTGCEL